MHRRKGEWRAETADGADLSIGNFASREEARQFANIRADERGTRVTRLYWYNSPKRNPMTSKKKTPNPTKHVYRVVYRDRSGKRHSENVVASDARKACQADLKHSVSEILKCERIHVNPRAHIPALRGRGRPAKKRRRTVLEWTDKKGHKHKLEFKGHSVESMKQLATSMVAYGETNSVIVDY